MWKILITWISGLWNGADPTKEVKLLAYGVGVLFAIGWLTGALIAKHGEITTEWNYTFLIFCSMIAAGVGIEAFSKSTGGK